MSSIENSDVAEKFQAYPRVIRRKLMFLRERVLAVAAATPEIGDVEETLKWGEPSYLVTGGSTIRIGWQESSPEQYSMYFNCNTKLVDTFKEVYPDTFNYAGNRAIVFHGDETVPALELEHCIFLSLRYHKIKHLPLLGI